MSNKARRRSTFGALLLWWGTLACATSGTSSAGPAPPRVAAGTPAAPSPHVARAGEELVSLDLDGDGRPDAWTYTATSAQGGREVVRRERDLDGDGRTDLWEELVDGRVATRALDLDGDGRPDLVLRYERGELAVREYAFDKDGRPRARSFYAHGELVRRERDLDGDGKPDAWESWTGGELDRVSGEGAGERRRPARPPAQAGPPAPQK